MGKYITSFASAVSLIRYCRKNYRRLLKEGEGEDTVIRILGTIIYFLISTYGILFIVTIIAIIVLICI